MAAAPLAAALRRLAGAGGGPGHGPSAARPLRRAAATRPRSPPWWAGTGRWCWASAAACWATRPTTPRTPSRPPSWSWPARPARFARRPSLASWLHGVAYRTALKVAGGVARRRAEAGVPPRESAPRGATSGAGANCPAGARRGAAPAAGGVPGAAGAVLPRRPHAGRGRGPPRLAAADVAAAAGAGAGTARRGGSAA